MPMPKAKKSRGGPTIPSNRRPSWLASGRVREDVIDAAAKHLHLRGYFGINLAELDEAVRLTIGEADCDPFDSDLVSTLGGCYTNKQQIAIDFLERVLDGARNEALVAVAEALKKSTHPQYADVNAVH